MNVLKYLFVILFCIMLCSCKKHQTETQIPATLNIKWQKRFGGSGSEFGESVAKTTDGGYILAGVTQSSDGDVQHYHGKEDILIVKLNAAGETQWIKAFGGSGNDYPEAIIPTTDGGYVIGGLSSSQDGDISPHSGPYSALLLKIDAMGNKLWDKCIGSNEKESDHVWALVGTADGGIVATGETDSKERLFANAHSLQDIFILKADQVGNIQWSSSFGGSGNEWGIALITTSDGGYAIAGSTYSSDGDAVGGHGNTDLFLVKVDGTGKKQWSSVIGGSESDNSTALLQTSDGGFLLTGMSGSNDGDLKNNHGVYDGIVAKTDATGKLKWTALYGGTNKDNFMSITPGPNGGFLLAGSTLSTNNEFNKTKGLEDIWLATIDGSGKLLRNDFFGGTKDEQPGSIIETGNNNYVMICGTASSDGDVMPGEGDIWVLSLGY